MAFRADNDGQADSALGRRFGGDHLSPITFYFSPSPLLALGACHKSAMLGQSNSRSWSFLFIGILEGLEDQADPPRT